MVRIIDITVTGDARMPMPDRLLLAVASVVLAAGPAAGASTRACSPKQAEAADAMTDKLDSWAAVTRYYRQFAACDNGNLAEASSDAIVKLLANHWNTLSRLGTLSANTPGLRRFVVDHVNSTAGTELTTVRTLSATRCPAGQTALCASLHRASIAALRG